MNLVHSRAVRKQLVAIILSIVNCMFYSCQLSAVPWWLPWVPLMFRVIGPMQWCIAKNRGGWRRVWRYSAYLWSLRWVYAIQKKPGGWYTAYTRVYPPNTTGPMRVCPSPKRHLDQFSYYFTAYSCVQIITSWPTFGHFAAHLSLPGSKHKKQSTAFSYSTFPHSTCHSTNFLQSHSIGWLSIGNSIRPVKIEWWGVGVVICLELGADCLHVV